MLSSLNVDFCITQLVDGTLGVHGMIPKGMFKKSEREGPERVCRSYLLPSAMESLRC